MVNGKCCFTVHNYPLPSVPSVPIDNVFEGPPSGKHTCFTVGKCCLTNGKHTLPSVNLTCYLNKNLQFTNGKCHIYENYHPYLSMVLDPTHKINSVHHWSAYKLSRNRVTQALRGSKSTYYRRQFVSVKKQS